MLSAIFNKIKSLKIDKGLLIVISLILLFSYPIYSKTFDLGLYGDDWIFVAWARKPENFVYPKVIQLYVLGSYASSALYMKFLYDLFGYASGAPYYITSYIFRLIASVGFYLVGKSIFNSKIVGITLAILFSINVLGFETTDWVFNAFAYLSIFFICTFLILFIKQLYKIFSKFEYLLMIISFVLALMLMPHRSNGLIALIVGIDLLTIIFARPDRRIVKKIIFRQVILITVFLLLWNAKVFGSGSDNNGRLGDAYSLVKTNIIEKKDSTFLFNPFINVSNMFIPDTSINYSQLAESYASRLIQHRMLVSFYAGATAISMILAFLVGKLFIENKKRNKFYLTSLISFSAIYLCIYLIHKANYLLIPGFALPLNALFGAFFIGLSLAYFLTNIGDVKSFPRSALVFLSIFAFLLIPTLYSPTHIYSTFHRYMITSVFGPLLFVGTLLNTSLESIKSKKTILNVVWFGSVITVLVGVFIYGDLNRRSTISFVERSLRKHPQIAVTYFWDEFFNDNASMDQTFLFIPKDEVAKELIGSTIDFSSTGRIMVERGFAYTHTVPTVFMFNEREFINLIKETKRIAKVYEVRGYAIKDITKEYFILHDISYKIN